jgi:hypothetical protein
MGDVKLVRDDGRHHRYLFEYVFHRWLLAQASVERLPPGIDQRRRWDIEM